MAKTKSKSKTVVKKNTKSAAKGKSPVKAKAKAQAKPKLKAKPKAMPKAKASVKAKSKSKVVAKPKAKAQPISAKIKMPAAKKALAKPAKPKAAVAKAKASPRSIAFKFAPTDNRILVSPTGFAEKTAGGLYIPESVVDRPSEGQVMEVGPGHRNKKGQLRPLDVQKGDRVLFAAYTGTEVEIQGATFLILREDEVLGVFRN